MRMSNTKPIKNTMRKQSPINMLGRKGKESIKAAVAVKKAAAATKKETPTVKTGGTKPVPTATTKTAAAATPAMQLKKRKC